VQRAVRLDYTWLLLLTAASVPAALVAVTRSADLIAEYAFQAATKPTEETVRRHIAAENMGCTGITCSPKSMGLVPVCLQAS
jgi:predicted transcriptional regulator